MSKLKCCKNCRVSLRAIIEERAKNMLRLAHEEPMKYRKEAVEHAESCCFHLMELRRILEGETTCGVYDSYGPEKQKAEVEG